MKRVAFIRELERAGCSLLHHGSRHDIYTNPTTGRKAPVPRHAEIKESLCRLIRRQLGIVPPEDVEPADGSPCELREVG